MKDGKIIKWNVKIGDKVLAGDTIAEIQTDKSAVGFEVQDDGYIAQILAKEGVDSIEVGEPIVVITKKKDGVSAFANYSNQSSDKGDTKPSQQVEHSQETASSEQKTDKKEQQQAETSSHQNSSSEKRHVSEHSAPRQQGERVIASPYARTIAKEKNIDLSSISGTGPNGRIKAADVLNAKPAQPESQREPSRQNESKKEAPSKGDHKSATTSNKAYVDQPLSQMRKVIGQRLTESKQNLPHYYVTMEIRMDKLISLRKQINEDLKEKISVNDFIIKAAALACKLVPEVNSQWLGDNIRRFEEVDVCFAVAIESGLITPMVTSAESKSIGQIAAETKDLIARAKINKLKPEEYMGGTFTISNLGMFGIKQFTAIINPPQACILAVGSTEQVPVYSETAPNKFE